jgi:hypothetical protein
MPFDIELRDPGATFDIDFGGTPTINIAIFNIDDAVFSVIIL